MSTKALELLEMARELAGANAAFQEVLGPGAGDHATKEFMRKLRMRALESFGTDHSEKKICGETSQAVDFYFPDEGTIVEVALGLQNPASEYEKDILKAIMAQECGHKVDCLFFISRPGAAKKCTQPGRRGFKDWALAKHLLHIEVHELNGEPRVRRKRSRSVAVVE